LEWNATLEVVATITNVGDRVGEAVPQLYVHDRVASRVRPVRELKGFCKVLLEPGESQRVFFTLSREDLAFCGAGRGGSERRAEPGAFDLWLAASSAEGERVSFELLPLLVELALLRLRARLEVFASTFTSHGLIKHTLHIDHGNFFNGRDLCVR
jgi:hypothetical protein